MAKSSATSVGAGCCPSIAELPRAAVAASTTLTLAPWESFDAGRKPGDQIARFRRALAVCPRSPQALNALAWALVDPEDDTSLHDPEEALRVAKKAVALTSRKDADILDPPAVAHFANGEVNAAVSVKEEILRLMAGKDFRGMTVTEAEAALERYRQALKIEKKNQKTIQLDRTGNGAC